MEDGSWKFLKPCFDVSHDAAGFDEFLAGVARANVKTLNLAAAFVGDGGVNRFLPLPDFDHTNLLCFDNRKTHIEVVGGK